MENDKISKIEDKEYPDFDLKNCDKENIVIKTKSQPPTPKGVGLPNPLI